MKSRCIRSEGALVVVEVILHQAVLGGAVQAGRLLAREGVLGVVTDQSELVKHSPVTTEETPPESVRTASFQVETDKTNNQIKKIEGKNVKRLYKL